VGRPRDRSPFGGRRARPWRFAGGALWDLVALPEAVVAWVPERIADAELRAYAIEQRAQHPLWLRLREVARRYHVTPGAVAGWVAQGRFAAVQVQRYGGIWIRADALDTFVAPCERPVVRHHCCGRRVWTGAAAPPSAHRLICAACWPMVRVLPGGHLLRLLPPADVAPRAGTRYLVVEHYPQLAGAHAPRRRTSAGDFDRGIFTVGDGQLHLSAGRWRRVVFAEVEHWQHLELDELEALIGEPWMPIPLRSDAETTDVQEV